MPSAAQTIRMYQELATLSDRQGQPQMHDRFLVLAADAAFSAGQPDEAERLRLGLLEHNPHHLLKPYASFTEAMQASDVVSYVVALRRSHPQDASEQLLNSLRRDTVESSDDPLEGAAFATSEAEWSMTLDAVQGPEALKVYRGQEPPEPPKAKPSEGKPQPAKPSRVDPVEAPRPKPARPAAPPVVRSMLKPLDDEPAAPEGSLPPTLAVPKPRSNPVPPPAPPPVPRQAARPPTTVRPAPTRDVYALRSEGAAAKRQAALPASEEDDGVYGGSYWVSTILFGLLLALGGGLAIYTLARPLGLWTRHS